MIITETGILVSTDPNMRDPAPLNFKIEGGQVGDNSVRATGLTADTTYYAQSYFVRDGMYIRQKGLTEFKTAAQEEVLKIKNSYAGSNTIGINKVGNLDQITLDYSTDSGETWNTWNSANGNFSVTLAQNGELWLKGNNQRISMSGSQYYYFSSGNVFDCEGSLSAIIKKDLQILPDRCFTRLFENSKVRVAPSLPNDIPISPECYSSMFRGCTSLTQAPSLPATTLAPYCYSAMFYGCTALTQTPSLPATTLSAYCYSEMFRGCTSLTQAPSLPATTIASGCYQYMFALCTSLTQATSLPATTIASRCYAGMFDGCTALATAPSLPATGVMPEGCYSGMFRGTAITTAPELPGTSLNYQSYYCMFYNCTSLTQAPSELPATTLGQECYYFMFYNCTSLTTAPVLADARLATDCYGYMFNGCTSLNKIICYATSWNTGTARNWVQNVASTGDFYNLGGATIPIDSVNGVPIGWTLHTRIGDYLTINNTSSGTNTVGITKTGNTNISLDYSTDNGSTWTNWTTSDPDLSVTLPASGTIKFKGTNSTFNVGYNDYIRFTSTANCSVTGDINTLVNEDGGNISIPVFAYLFIFEGMSHLTDISGLDLPSTTLSDRCYYGMFKDCTSITTVPSDFLPATSLWGKIGCYAYMFSGCASLVTLPSLQADIYGSGACYSNMFQDCTSLTTVPADYLPKTNIAGNCYDSMFRGCTSLTSVPNLPATTLKSACYQAMFMGCTSLRSVPANYLPATTLESACYNAMFKDCTSLVSGPTSIPATNFLRASASEMFCGCSSLTTAPSFTADTISDYSLEHMFEDCTSITAVNITFRSTAVGVYGCANMFCGCSSLTAAPSSLPATTIGDRSYMDMFKGCTSLTAAPSISASTIGERCCWAMFYGCTALTSAPSSLPATTLTTGCYGYMFFRCTALRNTPVLHGSPTEELCYEQMFFDCTQIDKIVTYATTWNTANANSWLANIYGKDFYNLGGANIPIDTAYDDGGIPQSWTVHTSL